MSTTNEVRLGKKLAEMYNNAPYGDSVAMIHLFGIRYADEIAENDANTAEIIKCARIQDSYRTELSKGIKLSQYVVDKEKIKALL